MESLILRARLPYSRLSAAFRGLAIPAPLVAALIAGAVTTFSSSIFNDGDTWLHIAAGERMLRLREVINTDPFTYTFFGRPWQTHEWFSEIIMALSFRLGGWSGVSLLFGFATGVTAGLLTRHLGRWMTGLPLMVVVVSALACLAPAVLARPHVLALPFLEMWAAELVIARGSGRFPSWARLAGIMVVWANLHGSFVFGLALLGAFGLDSVWERRSMGLRAFLPWVWLGPLVLAAATVSPHGIANVTFPLRLTAMSTMATIDEWKPLDPNRNPSFEYALLLCVLAIGWRGIKVPLFPLLLVLLLAHLTLHYARHMVLFALVTPLLLARSLGAAFGREVSPPRTPRLWLAAGAAFATMVVAARALTPFIPADRAVAPGAALAHVPNSVRTLPVYNGYQYGAYLLYHGVRPYIDSRAELFGDDFHFHFLRMQSGDFCAFGEEIARRRIGWTILEPRSALLPYLDGAPDWRRLFADSHAVIHVHQGNQWSGPPAYCPGATQVARKP